MGVGGKGRKGGGPRGEKNFFFNLQLIASFWAPIMEGWTRSLGSYRKEGPKAVPRAGPYWQSG